jgi:DNA repair photolyase
MLKPISNPPNPWDSTHVEYLGEPPEAALKVFEEEARSILAENESPDLGFRWSLNPYRGCFHACAYCQSGDTPILMGDARTKPLSDLGVGDEVYGTVLVGRHRRYVKTTVLNHWRRLEPAYRVELEDGTRLIASADHRFLTQRGWKHVTGREHGRLRRSHLTPNNHLLGTGRSAQGPEETTEYRKGYLCGVIPGDGLLRSYAYHYDRRHRVETQHQFQLALVDLEALHRARRYLRTFAVETREYLFQAAVGERRELTAIRTHARPAVDRIREIVEWPSPKTSEWLKGFLAGIFDAEGSYSRGILRICNTDMAIINQITEALTSLNFDFIVETRRRGRNLQVVRIRRGLREHLRFFQTVDPAITRKRNIEGQALKNGARLRVVSVEPLGVSLPLYDITTGTGDFIANGVVSHNCYARTSHEYLGFGAGTDFDRKIVVKVNAPELLRAQLSRPIWKGETIIFSGNTDCYQPLEAVYDLTRRCLEVCAEFRNPIAIITKGALVRRDVELLARMSREASVSVLLSIPFSDDAMSRAIEPNASLPSQRFETLRILSEAGIRTGVGVAPVIPGLNDSQISAVLERARSAGATSAFLTLIRLAGQTLTVFRERLELAFPGRANKVWSAIQQVRGGKFNESRFGLRMHGIGPRWDAIRALFDVECRRLGLNGKRVGEEEEEKEDTTFRRPGAQRDLFGTEE